jgi:hypothetical protein
MNLFKLFSIKLVAVLSFIVDFQNSTHQNVDSQNITIKMLPSLINVP